MIRFNCSECDQAISASEEDAGKKARCPGCRSIVAIPSASTGGKSASAAERRPSRPRDDPDEDAPPKKKKPVAFDEEDDERIVETPRSPRRAVRRREEDEEDEDDRPSRRRYREEDEEERPSRRRPRDEEDEDDRPSRRRYREEDEEDEADQPRRKKRRGPYADCPACGCRGHATKVSYTFWGGFIGPLIISTVRCKRCATTYNGTHGDYNTVRILIYYGVAFAIGLVAFLFHLLTATL